MWSTVGAEPEEVRATIALAIERIQREVAAHPELSSLGQELETELARLVRRFTIITMWPDGSNPYYEDCRDPITLAIQAKMDRHDTCIWLQKMGAKPWS